MTEKTDMLKPNLRLVAWEITRRCNLSCAHCRASAEDMDYEGELTTEEGFKLIDSIAEVGRPILILTGGEPLSRPDVFQLAGHAAARGLRVVLGTNGTLLTEEAAAAMKDIPIARVGVSIDFPAPKMQDRFRGKDGAFNEAVAGIRKAQRAGIEVQINSTITRMNAPHLDDLLSMAIELDAVAFHPFMLVPTGRGKGLANVELSAEEHERILNWIYDKQLQFGDRISFKPTDAPHYMRIALERGRAAGGGPSSLDAATRGCLAGVGFCFISHVGRVQGCGYLDVEAGNVREASFPQIWSGSPLFAELRDLSNLKGKCGVCEYRRPCGGCRARAYEVSGDYLAPEPYCIHRPQAAGEVRLDDADRQLLNALQWGFPLSREPFAEMGESLGLDEDETIARTQRLRSKGAIRAIGPVLDRRRLGHSSTLVAMRVPEERLARAVEIINRHSGVSHNYLRDNDLNLWFTLTVPPQGDLDGEVQMLADDVGPQRLLSLPAVRTFKLSALFDVVGDGNITEGAAMETDAITPLDAEGKSILDQLQTDLPLIPRPFDPMAKRLDMGVDQFLECCRRLKERGVLRRFGASLNHRRVGFGANAMVCWEVPPSAIETAGETMAAFSQVSHCYQRETAAEWPYNLFTMVHEKTRGELEQTIERMAADSGIRQYQTLFTIEEYKKERVRLNV